jgi:PPOX class probable FMN-dependent enzyme
MDTIDRNDSFDVTSLEDLAAIYKAPLETAVAKQTDRLTAPGRAFIAASPFLILATGTAAGIDCSPKGDAPGFVAVLDDRTLLIPDRPGNNRIDGMKNLIENPQVGIIFMVPGSDITFRVNGRAKISVDPALLERCKANGKLPRCVMVVAVDEAFPHCPKAFARADLWQAGAKGLPEGTPTHGDFAAHRDGGDADYARQYDVDYAKRTPGQLY